jgi:hypothetical protein
MRRAIATTLLAYLVVAMLPGWAVAAQTPEATETPPFLPWSVTDQRSFEVDGTPIALSPDGRWIAGLGPDETSICAWDVATLEPTCVGHNLHVQAHPVSGGLSWAPDSSAVAFINGDWRELESTDVMLFNVEHGWLRNITQTAISGRLLIHTGPAWTADSSRVVYAETDPTATDSPPSIIYYDRQLAIGVPVPLEDAFSIYAPVVTLPDDSVLFRIDTAPEGTENAGIWRVDPDGGNLRRVFGAEDGPVVVDRPVVTGVSGNGAYLTVASQTAIERLAISDAFFLVTVDSGEVRPVALEDGQVVSQPIFGESARFLLVQDGAGPGVSLRVMEPSSEETQVLEDVSLTDTWLQEPATWAASGTVLIPEGHGGTLLRLEWG